MRSSMRLLAGVLALAVVSLTPRSSAACDHAFYPGGYYTAAAYAAPLAFGYYIPATPTYAGGYLVPATPVYAYGYYMPLNYRATVAYAPPNATMHQSAYFSPDPSARPTATVTIRLRDDAFEPPTSTVAPGTMVVWVNEGHHRHSVTSKDGQWDSGDLAPGDVFRARVVHAGTYEFFCRHHRDMRGSITVK